MGLDQYAVARRGEPTKNEEGQLEYADQHEITYWRKHPNLQGWMESLYREKGGTEEFNCVDVELTLEDLDELEAAINGTSLPITGGFFFGENSDDYYKDKDLQFIEQARQEINDGYKVVYSSWW
jgi:hypothetical protein